ncbi:MAG TPA: hypothetical protein VFR04_01080 [Solirubrobacterales bacterium]|nr:hypothetical protein [Solirubrobacterales bacterium]
MSRLRTFALLAAVVVLATALTACGGGSSDDPQQVLDDATLEGVESGNIDASISVKSEGKEGSDVDVSLSGPFQSRGNGDLPELALTASANGKAQGDDVDFEGGLTLLSEYGFLNYEGTEYEIDPTTFGVIRSGFEEAQGQGAEGNAADVTACQEAAEGFEVGNFADELSDEGSVDVDGTSTTKVSGDLNTAGAIDALIKLTEDPACSAQLEAAGPLPVDELEEAKGELTSSVKKAHLDVYVGDDDIIRRVAAELTVEPEGTSGEKVEVEFDLTLSGVNEEQDISPPANSKPLEGLFRKLDINPIELLEAVSSGEGLGDLLEGLAEEVPFGDESSSGGSEGESGGGGGGQKAYLECLKGARTPTDLQKCASMIQ